MMLKEHVPGCSCLLKAFSANSLIIFSMVLPGLAYAQFPLPLGDLPAAGSITIEFDATVKTPPDIANNTSQVSSQATLNGGGLVSGLLSDDPDVGGASDATLTILDRDLDLTLNKTESTDPVIAGDTTNRLSYIVTITNNGPNPAGNILVSDVLTLPAGVMVLSAVPSMGSYSTPTWTIPTLANGGATATLTITLDVAASAAAGTDVISNNASISSAGGILSNTGDDSATVLTSISRNGDLSLLKTSSADPVVAGSNLIYTLSVTNNGPSDNGGGSISDPLPAGLSFVSSTDGCSEAGGVVTCPVPALAAGAAADLSFTVNIAPGTASLINNTATLSSNDDANNANNSASVASTVVPADQQSPQITQISSPGDSNYLQQLNQTCQVAQTRRLLRQLNATFDEAMFDPAGDSDNDDVSNPANYRLFQPGADFNFQSSDCTNTSSSDSAVVLNSVSYNASSNTAAIALNNNQTLADDLYRFIACGSGTLRDLAGNALDGDGDGNGGDDRLLNLRVESANRFNNGQFDCDINSWTINTSNASAVQHDAAQDADSASLSGALKITSPSGPNNYEITQCVAVTADSDYMLSNRIQLSAAPGTVVNFTNRCEFFSQNNCAGTGMAGNNAVLLQTDTGGQWLPADNVFTAPAGSLSARCGIRVSGASGAVYTALIDRLTLTGNNPTGAQGEIFSDQFESP